MNQNLYLKLLDGLKKFPTVFESHLLKVGSHTLGWITIILLHLSTFPTLIAVLLNTSAALPSVDIVIFIWLGLLAFFFKSMIEKNFLYITTNFIGFTAQTMLMGLILFK